MSSSMTITFGPGAGSALVDRRGSSSSAPLIGSSGNRSGAGATSTDSSGSRSGAGVMLIGPSGGRSVDTALALGVRGDGGGGGEWRGEGKTSTGGGDTGLTSGSVGGLRGAPDSSAPSVGATCGSLSSAVLIGAAKLQERRKSIQKTSKDYN